MANDLMKSKIEKARAGDIESAQALLRYFVHTVKARTRPDGTPHVLATGTDISLPWEYAQYLAEGFELALNGVDAGKALGIAYGAPGHPSLFSNVINDRDVDLVLAVRRSKREQPDQRMPFHYKRVEMLLKAKSARQVKSAWERKTMRLAAQLIEEMAKELKKPN